MHPVEKEPKDRLADVKVEIEGSINELELFDAPVQQFLHAAQKLIQWGVANRNIERGQTELASERATSGRLDINDPMGDVLIGVVGIGGCQILKPGRLRFDDFVERAFPRQEIAAQGGKGQIRFTTNGVIGFVNDGLAGVS